jgi:hypothetical protein
VPAAKVNGVAASEILETKEWNGDPNGLEVSQRLAKP